MSIPDRLTTHFVITTIRLWLQDQQVSCLLGLLTMGLCQASSFVTASACTAGDTMLGIASLYQMT